MSRVKGLIKRSRPRFWIYLIGPFLVGAAATWHTLSVQELYVFLGLLLFFSFPANMIVYGVNDVFDWETDRKNIKKQSYESVLHPDQHKRILQISCFFAIVGLVLAFFYSILVGLLMLGFLFLSVFYSAPPVRAKARPFIDSFFNGLYVFPGLISYTFLQETLPAFSLIAAAWLWTMAMHAYSAVPDIAADKRVGINTIATILGKKKTIIVCMLLYVAAAALSMLFLKWFAVFGAGIYVFLMIISFKKEDEQLFRVYRLFPVINTLLGVGLFLIALLK